MVTRSPLSYNQEFLCRSDSGDFSGSFSHRHILADAWRLTGRVDLDALGGALNDLVARHEILRTLVIRDSERPYQEIHPPMPATLHVRDLPAAEGKSRELQAAELLDEVLSGTLNVRELPVLRGVLGRFDDRDFVIVLVAHHTATDAWSMPLLIRDLMTLYSARRGHQPTALPEPGQYREFAEVQRARALDAATGDYWREKLRGAEIFTIPLEQVPADRAGSSYTSFIFSMDEKLSAETITLAKEINGSAFMVLLAAFYLLANKITGTTDPVVPTFSFGRGGDPRFLNTIGFCVNLLPIRTRLPARASFTDILALTRESCLEAYSHDVPFAHIGPQAPDLMASARAGNAIALFQVVQSPGSATEQKAGDIRYAEVQKQHSLTASPDLPGGMLWAFTFTAGGGIDANVLFSPAQFDEDSIAGWVSQYRQILAESLARPDDHLEL
jgi:condensation enzyme